MIHLKRVESVFRRHVRSYSVSPRWRQKEGWNDKLRILFCGTDEFSIESLKALHDESKKTDQISSIDVVTKKDQRTGRRLKMLTPPPIKQTAIDLNLPVHQIDTFTAWTPPNINLIVAVSFGLLIPPRILNASKYGGLNVHPSLLPDLRGAAPIRWAIMLGRKQTGVSIQTLHPSKFDEGMVLDQTVSTPIDSEAMYSALSTQLAPVGAKTLVNAIRNRLYLPPHQPVTPLKQEIALAPKIKTEDGALNFQQSREEICRRSMALGSLHAFAVDTSGKKLRIKFEGVYVSDRDDMPISIVVPCRKVPVGVPYAFIRRDQDVMACADWLRVNTKAGTIEIQNITVEGKSSGLSCQRAAQAKLFGRPQEVDELTTFYKFIKPLSIE